MSAPIAEVVFWAAIGSVVYTYFFYPFILVCLASLSQFFSDVVFQVSRRNRREMSPQEFIPSAALLVAAFNEEDIIEAKLENAARIEYPADKFEFLLGLDSPSDATAERARPFQHPNFELFHYPVRRGKLSVLKDLAERSAAEILVFSDANTMLDSDCVRLLARHFRDPRVGAVCGELRLVGRGGIPLEPLYWRIEMALKFLENRLNCVLGANGAVYAVRRNLFRPQKNWIVEDFLVPMQIRFSGYRVVYDPEAFGVEETAPNFSAEFRRRVRIGAGDYQVLLTNPGFLNPLKGLPAFAYFSHKVLRWLAPLSLLIAFLSNVFLLANPIYTATLGLQIGFYGLAFIGFNFRRNKDLTVVLSAPLHFSAMNLALFLGMLRFLSGRRDIIWDSTPRRTAPAAAAAKGVGRD